MNKVILTGNLCNDIELKQSTGGKSVVTNCVAVRRDYKGANGEYESDFINIVAWNNQAEYLSKYARKGDRVELCGRWVVRKYQAQDGTNRIANECVVDNITVFNKPKEEPKANGGYMPTGYGDNIPQFEDVANMGDLPF